MFTLKYKKKQYKLIKSIAIQLVPILYYAAKMNYRDGRLSASVPKLLKRGYRQRQSTPCLRIVRNLIHINAEMTWQRARNCFKLLSVLKVYNFIAVPFTIVSQKRSSSLDFLITTKRNE